MHKPFQPVAVLATKVPPVNNVILNEVKDLRPFAPLRVTPDGAVFIPNGVYGNRNERFDGRTVARSCTGDDLMHKAPQTRRGVIHHALVCPAGLV